MKKLTLILIVLLFSFVGHISFKPSFVSEVHAANNHDEEHHGHDHGHDEDVHSEGQHEDEHEHEEDDHDDHGHEEESHGEDHDEHEHEDGHNHGEELENDHSDEHHKEDNHRHGEHHDDHDEGKTEIHEDAARASGIVTRSAGPAKIQEVVTLTGRVMLNRNTTADVRARFPGVVQKVKAKWGEKVKKGQLLATIEANESLRSYDVIAPVSGTILTRNTNVGNVTGDEPLFTIADLSEVWAEFHVFPRDLSNIKEQQQVRVHTLENGKEIEAPITLILPTADPLSQTVIAVVSIPNHQGKWRPGMAVEGDVYISEKQVPLAVTEEAIQRMENKTVVFVKEGKSFEMRPVTLGGGDGKYIEVLKGLDENEEYVSQGSFIVKADIGKAAAKHEH